MHFKQTEFYSEKYADKQIIKNLTKQIKELKGDNKMSKIIQTANGDLIIAHNFEELDSSNADDVSEATELLNKLKDEVTLLETFVASAPAPVDKPADQVVNTSTDDVSNEPSVPATDTPASPEVPATPEAPVDPSPTPPTDPTPPVDPQPVPEATPTPDPITLQ
jgi:outer membrane biosynthesis protein TonB